VLRLTSSAVTFCALGFSAVLHAAVLLAPMGHAGSSRSAGDQTVSVDVLAELAPSPEVPEPEPTVPPPAGRAAPWPTHTHPYPVPPSHDWTPHDPNLAHALAPSASVEAPAAAAPAETSNDDTPRFTMAVGAAANDAHGAVSPSGTAPLHEEPAAPLAEDQVEGRARLARGVAPTYPPSARADGIEGDVRLELVVGTSGTVESARVVRGIGYGLDEEALRAARAFQFLPATRAGHAVRVRMAWSVQFRLQ
jgi:protein TonB